MKEDVEAALENLVEILAKHGLELEFDMEAYISKKKRGGTVAEISENGDIEWF